MKKDFFSSQKLSVIDLSFGSFHTLVLCYDHENQINRVFGCG